LIRSRPWPDQADGRGADRSAVTELFVEVDRPLCSLGGEIGGFILRIEIRARHPQLPVSSFMRVGFSPMDRCGVMKAPIPWIL